MLYSYDIKSNNIVDSNKNPNFRAKETSNIADTITKPIKNVHKKIEDTVEKIATKTNEEEEKKSNKRAIIVGSSVLGISLLIALLNPKNSRKLMSKFKSWQQYSQVKLEYSKNNYLKSKFHKACLSIQEWCIKTLQFSNNFNSAKDIFYKWLCCEKKPMLNIRNKTKRKHLKNFDSGFRKIMEPQHRLITKWFDNISKFTVKNNYRSASKKLDNLEALIKQYRGKLSPEKQAEIDCILEKIRNKRGYFAESNTTKRLENQEVLMENLERDFMKKYRSYKHGFTNKWQNKGQHITSNMSFWAEEIMMPTRNKLETEGKIAVETLFGGKEKKGLYDEAFDIIATQLNSNEKKLLEKSLEKASEKIKKANYSECVEYFDKKRDLVLGSAPTDILTAVVGLGLCGYALAAADNKEERLSKSLTGVFPIVAGLGANLIFTAMLFSGVQGMLYGALTSIGLSKLGSIADKKLLNDKRQIQNQEVRNA